MPEWFVEQCAGRVAMAPVSADGHRLRVADLRSDGPAVETLTGRRFADLSGRFNRGELMMHRSLHPLRRKHRSVNLSAAVDDVRAGKPVVVLQKDGFGELLVAASEATSVAISFVVRHASGLLFVALPADVCDRLLLPRMWYRPDASSHDYAVTVDASSLVGTGISANDRAETARRLASPDARPDDFARPGHMLPIRVQPDAIGTELSMPAAALALMRLAGEPSAAVLSPMIGARDPRGLCDRTESVAFAAEHGLSVVTVQDTVRSCKKS
jgi:3,4-dihydroxy 2-butanone 4-phosphate synthase/GTP cyclohydrolase II